MPNLANRRALDLDNRFTSHPPRDGQGTQYMRIRDAGLDFARLLADECPASDELKQAVDLVDTAVMKANAAIARHS